MGVLRLAGLYPAAARRGPERAGAARRGDLRGVRVAGLFGASALYHRVDVAAAVGAPLDAPHWTTR